MALLLRGKTKCPLCGKTIEEGQEVVAFPAFLPGGHSFADFSDTSMHESCFRQDSRSGAVEDLYARFREIWDSRPTDLKTIEEIEAWGREAFKNFP